MIQARLSQFDANGERDIDMDEEVIIQKYVPKKLQAFEGELFKHKWFDYRRMTPLQATLRYMQEYTNMYRIIYAREFDFRRAPYLQPANPTKILADMEADKVSAKAKFSGLWRGRQVADMMGMPYEIYLEWAMTFRLRGWQQAVMPQPQQLYREWDVERIQEKWEELQDTNVFLASDPAYMIENYRDYSYQNDYHEWLFNQASRRSNQMATIADFVKRDFLPIDKVAARFSKEQYLEMESYMN